MNLLVQMRGPSALEIPPCEGVDVLLLYWNAKQFSAERRPDLWQELEPDPQLRKFGCVAKLYDDRWRKYDRFMLADDDMMPMGCTTLDTFECFSNSGARIGHPSLGAGYYAHECSVRGQDWHVPWATVPFVELMAPMFTRDALEEYIPHFRETVMGWGLEQMWGNRERCVRLDGTPWNHTRPIGTGEAYSGLAKSPKDEAREFIQRHGLKDRSEP